MASGSISTGVRKGRPSRTSQVAMIERAMELLAGTQMSPSQIADAVGCDPATVTRAAEKLSAIAATRAITSRLDAMSQRIADVERALGCRAATPHDAVARMWVRARGMTRQSRPA